MARLGLGLGVAARRAARVFPGGILNAVSSPATFEALGATWTIGDLSPVLWCHADEGVTATGDPLLADAWADQREEVEYVWEPTSDGHPKYIEDARGHALRFEGPMSLGCAALAGLPVGSAAITVAMALEATLDGSERYLVSWGKAGGGGELGIYYGSAPIHMRHFRWTTTANGSAAIAQSTPFAGVVVARYTGTQLLLRISGTDADAVSVGGTLAVDTLTLGGELPGVRRLVGDVRELAIWDRSLTDAEAAAVDVTLRTAWGY